ncbi:GFA family protein [Roseobacter sinensis]|uniref:GFA family protein n=1 Tax=Roseobacter sinensis TaxID=2931391 RepID=A0ABT3BCH6_9RHOB|nr:GFA family protein [Roseobacter sp. WL0113]MCV3271281.1 GFA family protein [Roseobacter sp. WL0113]
MTITGSCACGTVRFAIEGRPSALGTCHCSRCRKLGSSTILFVTRDQFRLLSGADHIKTISPRPPYTYTRSFCRACGTALGEPLSPDASFPINAHCLDDDPGVAHGFHEFTEDRPAWDRPVTTEEIAQ